MSATLSADALTTVAALRSYLQREHTAVTTGMFLDDRLVLEINSISAAITNYCARQFICPTSALTYILDGDGRAVIHLPEWPIVAVTEVKNLASNVTIASRITYDGDGYSYSDEDARAGLIRLNGYVTDVGSGVVSVKARLGFDATVAATTPATQVTRYHRAMLDQLENACLQWCALLHNAPVPGAETTTIDQISYTVREQEIPSRIKLLLAPLRRGFD